MSPAGPGGSAAALAHQDAQAGFVTLLSKPMLAADAHPEEFTAVSLNLARITEWAGRLDYRVSRVGRIIRLHRVPIGGEVAAPPAPREPLSRRQLVLMMMAAATLEDAESSTTLQDIADRVRALTARADNTIAAYDPDMRSRAEWRALVNALRLLEDFGVLRRATRDDLLEQWAETGQGIGAGYSVAREALLALTDPQVVATALAGRRVTPPTRSEVTDTDAYSDRARAGDDIEIDGAVVLDAGRIHSPVVAAGQSGTRARLLRLLLETPFLAYAALDAADLDYLRNQQTALVALAEDMTGGQVESRTEGLVLLLDPARPESQQATVDWPAGTTDSWIALTILDRICAETASRTRSRAGDGSVAVPADDIAALACELDDKHASKLKESQRGRPQVIAQVATAELAAAGLIRVENDGAWIVAPVAARYRDPLVHVADDPLALFASPLPAPGDEPAS